MDSQLIGYLAPQGAVDDLAKELGSVSNIYDHLVLSTQKTPTPVWVQNIWYDPVFLPIKSISDGVKALKKLNLRWSLYPVQHHRRAQLIQEQLPHYKISPLSFLGKLPDKPLGSWSLIEENLILASTHCSSSFPNGVIEFQENRQDPPSRAYLKLWELFTIEGFHPKSGQICLDLGSSPGGWTWVLQQLGCQIISVDKAPLHESLQKSPQIQHWDRSAFSLAPDEVGPIDWLFSDVICYPERLLKLIHRWIDSGLCQNFVATLKFQGATDFGIIKEFAAIPNSKLIHLYHNKHELTFFHTLGVKID